MTETGLLHDGKVSLELVKSTPVKSFLANRKRLDANCCLELVEQGILVLDGLYVHLSQKRALYAVDPVRRLRLLRARLASASPATEVDDLWFHREMIETFTSVRDLHTMYVLPEPFDRSMAFLPFRIEACRDDAGGKDGERRFIVTRLYTGLPGLHPHDAFRVGVEVTHWNGVPIRRAVEILGAQNSGSNLDARIARGLARLTARPLTRALPPDEEWVTVRCLSRTGQPFHQRADWRVATFGSAEEMPDDFDLTRSKAEALDHETHLITTWNKLLYSRRHRAQRGESSAGNAEEDSLAAPTPGDGTGPLDWVKEFAIDPALLDVWKAGIFRLGETEYGYIRLYTFKINDDAFLDKFAALLEQMPGSGLIIDIRDNPGGHLQQAEQLLQTLTPLLVEPETAQIVNTPVSIAVGKNLTRYRAWANSLDNTQTTGVAFSSDFPLSDPMFCNHMGQRYYGPVALITSALCYSSADIFAAGFKDHDIGTVIGVDRTTGAGGAEVITHSALCDRRRPAAAADQSNEPTANWPLTKLSRGDFRLAIRRMLRVRQRAGAVLEDLGVASDLVHQVTQDDLLHANVDLLRCAAAHLAGKPCYDLQDVPGTLRRSPDGKTVEVDVHTMGLDRLDVALDGGWSSPSVMVKDGSQPIAATVPPDGIATHLSLRGYSAGKLVAARRVRLPPVGAAITMA